MEVIISYDVDKNSQSVVKNALLSKGFKDELENGSETYNMPNTTLVIKDVKHPAEAKGEFDKVINALNEERAQANQIQVKRFVACGINLKTGIRGDDHKETIPKSFYEMSHKEKQDYILLILYRNTIHEDFAGSIIPYDLLQSYGYTVDNYEINSIVNFLTNSHLIINRPMGGSTSISFDSKNKGVEFVQNNSFSSPGTSILDLKLD